MRNANNHQSDIVKRMNMSLDNELTKEAELELLREMKTNPTYRQLLDKERSFREFIRSKMHRRKASPALVQSLKEKIRLAPNTRVPPE